MTYYFKFFHRLYIILRSYLARQKKMFLEHVCELIYYKPDFSSIKIAGW